MHGHCPSCGGISRKLLSPAWWGCDSLVYDVEVTDMIPNSSAPSHSGILMPITHRPGRRCGWVYHDPTGDEVILGNCHCGDSAYIRCMRDQKPVCGRHGMIRDGQVLCDEHTRAYDHERDPNVVVQRQHATAPTHVGDFFAALASLPIAEMSLALVLLLSGDWAHRFLRGTLRADFLRQAVELVGDTLALDEAFGHLAARINPGTMTLWEKAGHLDRAMSVELVEPRKGRFSRTKRHGRVGGWVLEYRGDFRGGRVPNIFALSDGTVAHNLTGRGMATVDVRDRKPLYHGQVPALLRQKLLHPPAFPDAIETLIRQRIRTAGDTWW